LATNPLVFLGKMSTDVPSIAAGGQETLDAVTIERGVYDELFVTVSSPGGMTWDQANAVVLTVSEAFMSDEFGNHFAYPSNNFEYTTIQTGSLSIFLDILLNTSTIISTIGFQLKNNTSSATVAQTLEICVYGRGSERVIVADDQSPAYYSLIKDTNASISIPAGQPYAFPVSSINPAIYSAISAYASFSSSAENVTLYFVEGFDDSENSPKCGVSSTSGNYAFLPKTERTYGYDNIIFVIQNNGSSAITYTGFEVKGWVK